MSQMGFELTIPVFKREKTVHALDRATMSAVDVTPIILTRKEHK
jgi:hypothetical protein